MLQFLTKLFVSILISNWIYSEIVLLWPGFDPLARQVYSSVKIPTHDAWPELLDSDVGQQLDGTLQTAWNGVAGTTHGSYVGLFDGAVKGFWDMLGFHSSVPVRRRAIDNFERPHVLFVSGKSFFTEPKTAHFVFGISPVKDSRIF